MNPDLHKARWLPPPAATLITLLLSAFVLAAGARAQDAAPVTLSGTQQVDLVSDINGHAYRLFVAPPEGYAAADTARYPVLYILDGYRTFPAALTARSFMDIYDGLDDVILVGVGDAGAFSFDAWFANRWRDYTPSALPATDSLVARQFDQPVETVRSGGGPDFIRVLREEILPFVDASYRTTDDRGLAGQSLGGLFAAYALFEAPGLFQRVGIHSPSLWWGDGELFEVEAAFAASHTTLPAHVLVTVGSEEGDAMVPPMERLAETLRSRGYEGLTVYDVVFEDETHTSVVPAQVSRTLRVLYPRRE
jgi:predicted alpha/beta superfamily hydrolase